MLYAAKRFGQQRRNNHAMNKQSHLFPGCVASVPFMAAGIRRFPKRLDYHLMVYRPSHVRFRISLTPIILLKIKQKRRKNESTTAQFQ